MTLIKNRKIRAGGQIRKLNVRADAPDLRDRIYEPALVQLKPGLDNRSYGTVLDQKSEGSCTGFGLAAVIDILNKKRNSALNVSPRMLYEMAKRHDEWPGRDYSGSSCRGAIRGWKNMGVCSESAWKYVVNRRGDLTARRAIEAQENTLGAYYRLRTEISDYHAALNETGAIYVSASVHSGWNAPKKTRGAATNSLAVITPSDTPSGGHAFAIVGYTDEGFIVQNSWGHDWGTCGCAIWRYEDWIQNVSDGWVLRLALSTPTIFNVQPGQRTQAEAEFWNKSPDRREVAGHFAHFDDGTFEEKDKYWSTLPDVKETAKRLGDRVKGGSDKYKHLVFYAHGGLNSPKASASRIVKMRDGFIRNGIYPYHIMYDTGLAEELKDIIWEAFTLNKGKSEGFFDLMKDEVTDISDRIIEDAVRKPGTAFWDQMKRDAKVPFDGNGDGVKMLKAFSSHLEGTNVKVHLIGHSTGAIVHGHLLSAIKRAKFDNPIASAHLMAPACTVDFYKKHYKPSLTSGALTKLDIYNLNTKLELGDQVAGAYRKSLIELVSRAFERGEDVPILGIQEFNKGLNKEPKSPKFIYSNGSTGSSRSTTHGGFDNDADTMNSILKSILKRDPKQRFTDKELR